MISTTCSKCGATMEIDLDHIQVYCPYCGNKLSVELDKINDVLIEKEKTKQKQFEKEKSIYTEQSLTERAKIQSKTEKQTGMFSGCLGFLLGIIKIIFIVGVIAFILCVAIGFLYLYFSEK